MRPDQDRPRFPDFRDTVGEDPARFLATDVDPEPRIRGIADLGVANAWVQAARELDVDESIEQAIEQRRDDILRNHS